MSEPAASVVFVYAGEQWNRDLPIWKQDNAVGHIGWMRQMVASGAAIAAGPLFEVTGRLEGDLLGVVLYDRPAAEAAELAAKDPAVVGGQLRVEVRPFYRVAG